MKKIQAAFAILFCAIIFLPLLFIDAKSKTNARENRTLANAPQFLKDGKFNSKFSSEFEAYANDRFGFRDKFIALNEMTAKMGRSTLITERAIQGKDDWIFFLDEGNGLDFFKMNLYTQDELSVIEKNTLNRKKFCEENGMKFIVFLCPSKHNVYPEKYIFEQPKGLGRGEQVYEALKKAGVDVVYPLKEMLLAKEQYPHHLYLERDTHWNSLGAKIGSDCLIERIKAIFPQYDFPNIEYDIDAKKKLFPGDLCAMLGLENGPQTWVNFFPKDKNQKRYVIDMDLSNPLKDYATNSDNENFPTAKVFCDSYYQVAAPFLAPYFSEMQCKYSRFYEQDKAEVLAKKPDLVILEILERNLDCLFDDFNP